MWPPLPPKKKEKKENPLWCFFKVTAFYSLGYRKILGKKEIPIRINSLKGGRKRFQHEESQSRSCLSTRNKNRRCIITIIRTLYNRVYKNFTNNYSGCFCVFYKKTTNQKHPHTQTNKPITNVSTLMPICYNGYIQYVKRYVS